MQIDFSSFLAGSVITIVVAVLAVLVFLTLVFGKAKTQIKFVLSKLYSRLSLMLIAMFDVVAAFDPSQTVLGLAIGWIAGIVVFLVEWGLNPKTDQRFDKKRFFPSLIEGFIAALIVMIPFPIAGLFVAWFGVLGDQKKRS